MTNPTFPHCRRVRTRGPVIWGDQPQTARTGVPKYLTSFFLTLYVQVITDSDLLGVYSGSLPCCQSNLNWQSLSIGQQGLAHVRFSLDIPSDSPPPGSPSRLLLERSIYSSNGRSRETTHKYQCTMGQSTVLFRPKVRGFRNFESPRWPINIF
jgi:hypothetical protein